jgi:hypothetical protein
MNKRMNKRDIVERLRFLGCPAVMQGSVDRNVRLYPKALLQVWLTTWEEKS